MIGSTIDLQRWPPSMSGDFVPRKTKRCMAYGDTPGSLQSRLPCVAGFTFASVRSWREEPLMEHSRGRGEARSGKRELAHSFMDAMESGDWDTANKLMPKTSPVHEQLALRVLCRDGDTLSVTMELSDAVRGFAAGSIHGGILATFADVASAFSLHGTYSAGNEMPVTTDMHIRYYRQPGSGPLKADATVVHIGRRFLSSECVIADAENRVLARSTATYAVVPIRE